MLLKHLYDFAISRKLLDHLAFKRETPVRWIIDLDAEGKMIGQGPRTTEGAHPNRGKEFDIPKTTRPTGSGQVADFLVDDVGAIFGLNPKPQRELNERATRNLKAKHHDFWRRIREADAATRYQVFSALLKYHSALAGEPPVFLRIDQTGSVKWMVRTAGGEEVRLGNDFFTFAVGDILITREDIKAYWRNVVADEMAAAEASAARGVCLVTGETNTPLARTHTPMITGLPKTNKNDQIKQRGIVGFESDSFRSYGFEKSYNAPISIIASKAYLLALQHLSSRKDHWLSLGPAWLCFWAAESEEVSSIFAQLLRKPDQLTVRNFMVSPWSGLQKPPPDLENFNAVTFTAAGPRIVVKDWLQVSVAEAVANFRTWFSDLEIQAISWSETGEDDESAPLSIRWLAHTSLMPDSKGRFDEDKLKPDLMASLYRAALMGSAPGITLLKSLLDRLQANIGRNGTKALYDQSRFALLRLIVNRTHRNRKESKMEIPPKLPAKTGDPAYNCGCLLSVLNSLQRSAHNGKLEGATIAERYYGSASTNPSAAFSLLWRLHQHHLKKLRQKGEKGQKAAHRIKEAITEICSRFTSLTPNQPPQMPRVFTLVEQARFALGFYQQEAARAEAVRLWKQKQQAVGRQTSPEDPTEEDLSIDTQA
jgi:CRISPR-associated protein Csd1